VEPEKEFVMGFIADLEDDRIIFLGGVLKFGVS
jgi:hypothetical protein